jgi:hypothetical protein
MLMRHDAGDGAGLQAQARIEAKTEGHATHQRAEVEVEGIADEGHQHHGGGAEFVAGVAPAQQVKAAVQREAGDGMSTTAPQAAG